jgi:pimeloyl-ACP methyl ester carboxylesterase
MILFLLITCRLSATIRADTAFTESSVVLHTATGDIFGTITLPKVQGKVPVALIIAGSGPTDRNGNNPVMKNESLHKLATGLAGKQVASLRYDKRGIGESKKAAKAEAELRFEDYVNDARAWIDLLKKDRRFSKVVVTGHSEGSLIGMIAAAGRADMFVSIAGAGKSADKLLKEQLASQPQMVKDISYPILDSLVSGKEVKEVNPLLYSLFRPSVQPYMISWFRFDPQAEIAKLQIPVLILQGTNDIQVTEEDAKLLASANPRAKLVLVKNMNHIFAVVEGDKNANLQTYGNASLPVSTGLIQNIAEFIRGK